MSITHRLNPGTKIKTTPPPSHAPYENHDFYWTKGKDPHTVRRMQILQKYPSVNKLCGVEPKTKYIVGGVVAVQFTVAFLLRDVNFWSFKFWLAAYVIGATATQNCFLAIHELSHNLGFRKPINNKLFSIFANLPIGIPYSASFQPYHLLHHKFLGDPVYDTDLPTRLEAIVLSNVLGKAFFATCQILFYALRPMFITQIDMTLVHLLNVAVNIFVDYLVVTYWSWNSLFYFILSAFLAGSLHPCAGHFIAEHYIFDGPKKFTSFEDVAPLDTYSYYGVLNFFTWNVGYHNEHHDFPFIAWSKLPQLREMASEFYSTVPQHTSWVMVIYNFILDDNVLLWNRVKRLHEGEKERERRGEQKFLDE